MRLAFRGIVKSTLVGAMLLVSILLSFSCGGGGDRSAEAVEWEVSRQVGSRQVELAATVEYCGGEQGPTLEQPVVEYASKRVFIELLLASQEESDDRGCPLSLLGVYKTITLKRDLDELVLFDSSIDPPEPRWPTH